MAPELEYTQCAAVTTMSPCGLDTTLPVQWCDVNDPFEVPNSVPTCAAPEKVFPWRGFDTLIAFELGLALEVGLELGLGLALGLEPVLDADLELKLDDTVGVGVESEAADTELELTSLSRPPTFA